MKAAERLNAPPITPVATTDRVSRYTQNVSANHRNELVTPLMSVLMSSWRNVASSDGATPNGSALVSSSCSTMTVFTALLHRVSSV